MIMFWVNTTPYRSVNDSNVGNIKLERIVEVTRKREDRKVI